MHTKLIAEISSCHNGDLDLAKALIHAVAQNAPGSICKFQDWRADNVPIGDHDKKRYKLYQFPDEWYDILIPYCQENGVEFMTTVFNKDRVKFLASLGLRRVKIASISMTHKDLLLEAGANFEELIVSTAFHSREEIEETVDWLATNAHKFTLMACTANYPTLPEDANLARIDELKKMMEGQEYSSVGFSDHSLDNDVAKMALSKGITYLEKHFSLSRSLPQIPHTMYEGGSPTTTHAVSIEPHELRGLADWRDKVSIMQGSGEFAANEVEQAIKNKYENRYGK